MLTTAIISAVISFVVTVVLGKTLIPVLKSVKMGQKILDIGPRWHKSKEGTPTMGGLFFAGGILVAVLCTGIYICSLYGGGNLLTINLLFVFASGLIGFFDDYVKFFKKQNKGFNATQKLVLQFASTIAYVWAMNWAGAIETALALPFTDFRLELGSIYYILLTVGIVFTVNSVNLTDGIDGLASSVTLVVTVFLAATCYKTENYAALILLSAVAGGLLGFLVYNFYSARVFMGDTGSLMLGGVVSAAALWLDMPLVLLFVGVMYYVEAFSVVIQVISYKLTKKRVFKMSPIHHHFEMCGWSEIKIVTVFSAVTIITSMIGCYGFLI